MITPILFDWSPQDMLEVILDDPDSFLKVKETLTRIGIASKKERFAIDGKLMKPQLYQSCHILHKHGKYFIVQFKELFALDGKPCNISVTDVERRNVIANLLQEWKLVKIVDPIRFKPSSMISQIKVVAYRDKENWELSNKYSIGKTRNIEH
jgi:hypothetical protein